MSLNILLVCAHHTFRFGHRGDINNAEKPFYLGRNLADFGHKVTLVYQNPFAVSRMSSSTYKGLTIYSLPYLASPAYAIRRNPLARGLRLAIEMGAHLTIQPIIQLRQEFDIVHSFWPGWLDNFIPVWLARNIAGSHTLIDFEDRIGGREGYYNLAKDTSIANRLKRFWFGLLENESTKLADAATASTDLMKRLLLSLGMKEDRIFKVPRGVDTSLYKPLAKDTARRRIGLDPACKVIGYLGGSLRLPEYHEILLRAFSNIRRNWPDSKLLLIGRRIPDTARAKISNLKLNESVLLTKTLQLEEIPTYLSAADVLALPLLDNFVDGCRWPNRLLEYMACGRPVVVSSVGEAPMIVAEHKCGSVAQSGNHTGFSEKIEYLLGHPKEATELGLRARAAVEENYTWPAVTKSTELIYNALNN